MLSQEVSMKDNNQMPWAFIKPKFRVSWNLRRPFLLCCSGPRIRIYQESQAFRQAKELKFSLPHSQKQSQRRIKANRKVKLKCCPISNPTSSIQTTLGSVQNYLENTSFYFKRERRNKPTNKSWKEDEE